MLKIKTPFDFMCACVGVGSLLVGTAVMASIAPDLGVGLFWFAVFAALVGGAVWALVWAARRFGAKPVATTIAALVMIAGGFILHLYLEERARVAAISQQGAPAKPVNFFDQFDPPAAPAKGAGLFDDLIAKAPARRRQ